MYLQTLLEHRSDMYAFGANRWITNMEKRGNKDIKVLGIEDKHQIIAIVSSIANGDLLSLQIIHTSTT
jgi:hypothetical protein